MQNLKASGIRPKKAVYRVFIRTIQTIVILKPSYGWHKKSFLVYFSSEKGTPYYTGKLKRHFQGRH